MKPNSDYARIMTAAHRGSQLSQQALDVIEEVRRTLRVACNEYHILVPSDFHRIQICETVASGLIEASPWLKAIADTQGVDVRV